MNIGFDLDGTITEDWINGWSNEEIKNITNPNNITNRHTSRMDELKIINHDKQHIIKKLYKIKMNLLPVVNCHIITSRPQWLLPITYKWIKKNNIPYLTINTYNDELKKIKLLEEKINHKAHWINYYKLDEYYEDELEIIVGLKKKCPDTDILYPECALINSRAKILYNF